MRTETQTGHSVGSNSEASLLALYRMIAERMPEYDTFLMHAAAISFDGHGFLFTGPSGIGKSTHISLWKETFGDRVVIINGDKPLVRVESSQILICGTPWCGKEGWNTNTCAPLAGIVCLGQSEDNHIRRISRKQALETLMHQTYRSRDPLTMRKTLFLLDTMVNRIPVYRLNCRPDAEAVRTAYGQLHSFRDAGREEPGDGAKDSLRL